MASPKQRSALPIPSAGSPKSQGNTPKSTRLPVTARSPNATVVGPQAKHQHNKTSRLPIGLSTTSKLEVRSQKDTARSLGILATEIPSKSSVRHNTAKSKIKIDFERYNHSQIPKYSPSKGQSDLPVLQPGDNAPCNSATSSPGPNLNHVQHTSEDTCNQCTELAVKPEMSSSESSKLVEPQANSDVPAAELENQSDVKHVPLRELLLVKRHADKINRPSAKSGQNFYESKFHEDLAQDVASAENELNQSPMPELPRSHQNHLHLVLHRLIQTTEKRLHDIERKPRVRFPVHPARPSWIRDA